MPRLFQSRDGGESWQEFEGLRGKLTPFRKGSHGSGGLFLHTILRDLSILANLLLPSRLPALCTDEGASLEPIRRGLHSQVFFTVRTPPSEGRSLRSIGSRCISRPNTLSLQSTGTYAPSMTRAVRGNEFSGNLPRRFDFPIAFMAITRNDLRRKPTKAIGGITRPAADCECNRTGPRQPNGSR